MMAGKNLNESCKGQGKLCLNNKTFGRQNGQKVGKTTGNALFLIQHRKIFMRE